MLPPFIIDQIRKREEEERRRRDGQPVVELPLPSPTSPGRHNPSSDDADRGVVIIDLFG